MIKLQYLSVLMSTIMMTGTAATAEIYNQDGNKLDMYGALHAIRYMSSDIHKHGDRYFLRYGLRGEGQLSNRIFGFGAWEYEVGLRPAESKIAKSTSTNLNFAGIKFVNAGGSIDYGRNYGVLYDVGAWTDVLPEFGGDTTIHFLAGRANSVLTYRNTNFFGIVDGLNFTLQYQGANGNKTDKKISYSSIKKIHGNGYGMSITYNVGYGVSAGAAFARSNRISYDGPIEIAFNQGKKAEAYSLGLKYDAYNLYLAALYSETSNMTPYGNFAIAKDYGCATKAQNLEVVAQYQFDFGLCPSIGYLQSRIDRDQNGNKYNIKKYIEIGAKYNFNKHMLTFIDYRINLLSKNNDFFNHTHIATDNVIALGMTYMF